MGHARGHSLHLPTETTGDNEWMKHQPSKGTWNVTCAFDCLWNHLVVGFNFNFLKFNFQRWDKGNPQPNQIGSFKRIRAADDLMWSGRDSKWEIVRFMLSPVFSIALLHNFTDRELCFSNAIQNSFRIEKTDFYTFCTFVCFYLNMYGKCE